MNKRIKYFLLGLFIFISVSTVGIFMLNKPTTISKYLTTDLDGTPANPAFNDDIFYKCIIKEYNDENGTSISENASLTDEQLATITYLRCGSSNGVYLSDTTGIEKLTSLTELDLSSAHLQILDLSKNKELISLNVALNYGYLTELDISKNTKLERLLFYDSYLTQMDFSNNPALKYVDGDTARLTTIDFTNNPELEYIDLDNNSLSSITGINNKQKLKTLKLNGRYGSGISTIDLSNDTALESLSINQNQLRSLVLDDSVALKTLSANRNKLESISLTHNTGLTSIDLSNNQLESIIIGNNTSLTSLNVSNNSLASIDLSNNTSLESITLFSNNFNKTQYLYVGTQNNISPVVKLPLNLPTGVSTTYISSNENIATITTNGVINAIGLGAADISETADYEGGSYYATYHIKVIELESDKYDINDQNNIINFGIEDTIDDIINNLTPSDDDITIVYNENDSKIVVKHQNETIKEFDIVGLLTDSLNVDGKDINIGNKNPTYEEFINSFTPTGTTIKIVDSNNNEITSGNIKSGMKLRVYVDNELLDTYNIVGGTTPDHNKDKDSNKNVIDNTEKVKTDDTGKKKSIIISIIGVILLIGGTTIITIISNNKKNKEDNI